MRSKLAGAVLLTLVAVSGARAEGLHMPPYRTVTLDNGLTVLLMRHATVPLVAFDLWVDAGAALDRPGREGLASLTAAALRKGAGDRDAAAFAEALDFLGADFGTSVSQDYTRIRLSLLARDLESGLSLLTDAVLRPAFDDEEVAKLAAQRAEAVAQAKDNPRNVLGDYHRAFLYGDHPYANPVGGTETSVAALGADDVRAFHRDHYGADRAILAVVGDIDPDAMLVRIRDAFADMPRARAERPNLPEPVPPQGRRVLLVNKNDTPQTWFMIGGLGPAEGAEDEVAAELVRTVFGGRFTSWLNTKLRIETGLTYGAAFRFSPGRVAGPASILSFTATETTREAMDLALDTLERLHRDGLTEEELASAKAYVKGQSPYDYETAMQLAGVIAHLAFYGLDRSEVDEYFDRIDAVDLDACRAVIAKYFPREDLVITAIGVADSVRDVLAGYGDLRVRENDDPGFR